jgi:NADH-quinone oxidoreductase subunit M
MGKMQIDYFVGIDGISITLLVMTSLVMVVAAIHHGRSKKPERLFYLFLILDMAVIGVFCSLDFFLFYIFYELMLLPLYFLIGMWGGAARVCGY